MFPPCRLNERSQAIVTNLHRNIQTSPAFQHLSVNLKSELLSTGCMSIEISNQGQPVTSAGTFNMSDEAWSEGTWDASAKAFAPAGQAPSVPEAGPQG